MEEFEVKNEHGKNIRNWNACITVCRQVTHLTNNWYFCEKKISVFQCVFTLVENIGLCIRVLSIGVV